MVNWKKIFDFVLPTKIIFGCGCTAQVANELMAIGGRRPLIITDKGIVQTGILNQVTQPLATMGIDFMVFDNVEPNPKDKNVEAGARMAKDFKADSLIAVGGGSPIDCAKSIGVLLAHGAEKIKPFEGKTAATMPQPPFITIPTTAGSGSEITFSSVITDTQNGYKMTVKSPFTAANTAICDPELTLSMPSLLTAATGIDALTHAIEGFTATCSEPLADATALYAIEIISTNLVQAFHHPDDLNARSAMLMGSVLAGIAFSHADVASVHCVAESLGSVYDLPHGVCNAIFLPYVMEYNLDYCRDRYARVARAMGFNFDSVETGARLAVDHIKQLTDDVRLPAFSSLPVDPIKFGLIAEMSYKNGSNASNPRPMTQADYM
ncbi:MAG: iron-containing alcohol dehydrogenase, partial [Tannerella sp.]|nr:iron-containing alcohol dehydrogenase [Tannerella sp.]